MLLQNEKGGGSYRLPPPFLLKMIIILENETFIFWKSLASSICFINRSGKQQLCDRRSSLYLTDCCATPDGIAAMQIGDGFITVRYPEQEPQLLFPPDKGEYINETTFVTSTNALKDMKVVVQPGQPEFICASTDGLERLAIRMSDWTPFTPFFQPLEQYLRETDNLEESDEYLLSFLNSQRLNARTDDDKTLFLCLYDSSSHPPQ